MTSKKKGAKPKKLGVKKESIRKQGELNDKDAEKVAGGGPTSVGGCIAQAGIHSAGATR